MMKKMEVKKGAKGILYRTSAPKLAVDNPIPKASMSVKTMLNIR